MKSLPSTTPDDHPDIPEGTPELAAHFVRLLNRALDQDPAAIVSLMHLRVPCTQLTLEDPDITTHMLHVGRPADQPGKMNGYNIPTLGVLGLINAIVVPLTGRYVVAVFRDRSTDEDGLHQVLLGFKVGCQVKELPQKEFTIYGPEWQDPERVKAPSREQAILDYFESSNHRIEEGHLAPDSSDDLLEMFDSADPTGLPLQEEDVEIGKTYRFTYEDEAQGWHDYIEQSGKPCVVTARMTLNEIRQEFPDAPAGSVGFKIQIEAWKGRAMLGELSRIEPDEQDAEG